MAGIGFVLRKLYHRGNLSGLALAYMHAALASTGPWLFTVIALGLITLIGKDTIADEALFNFRVILIYNFSFSLVIAAPVFMICTRYLADCIYKRDVSLAPGMLAGALLLLLSVEAIAAGMFYFFYADLKPLVALMAVVNFLLISTVWLVSIFISAMKNYLLITKAFFMGMLVAVVASYKLGEMYDVAGMLAGFSLGVAVIVAILVANVLVEYPYVVRKPFAFLSYFPK